MSSEHIVRTNNSGKAVQILKPETFEIDSEAVKNILEKNSDKPVAVISITGAFRTGKSFLLNFFLKYLRNEGHREKHWMGDDHTVMTDGFEWQAGASPHTTGIWMWSEPFIVESKGQEIAVILMDTQGTFSHDSDRKTNARIFALSTLLSSVQIFNVHKQLQANDLEYFQYFTEISRLFGRRKSSVAIFQGLIFLVRDWSHKFDYKYGREGGNQYLKKECAGHCGKSGEIQQYLSQVFQNLDCCLLPYPGDLVAISGNNFTGKLEGINEDFIKEVKSLTEHLLDPDNLIKKTVAGEVYTCKQLYQYAEHCHECVKNGPEPKTYLQAFTEFTCSKEVTKSFSSFNEKMTELIKSGHRQQEKYRQVFDHVKLEILAVFDEDCSIGDDNDVHQEYKHKLESEMNDQYNNYKRQFYNKRVVNLKRDIRSILSNFKSDVDECLVSICSRLRPILDRRNEALEKLQGLQDNLDDSDFYEEVKNLIIGARDEINNCYVDAENKIRKMRIYYIAFAMFLSALYVAPFTTLCLVVVLFCLHKLFSVVWSWNITGLLSNVISVMGNFMSPTPPSADTI